MKKKHVYKEHEVDIHYTSLKNVREVIDAVNSSGIVL